MNKSRYILPAAVLLLAAGFCSFADEGMWLVQSLDSNLEGKMRKAGLEIGARDIYNTDSACLKDAVVSLNFCCTGSLVSPDGLVITNHHCAYSDVHNLSTQERNLLEDGFFAKSRAQEIPIHGSSMQFLEKVLDVTAEVEAIKDSISAKGQYPGSRKLSWIMEKRYAGCGYDTSLDIMWSGKKYYLSFYRTYNDIRLVAAPPVSIAAFGGDTDNWEWPQQKCDFAMYRIYTAPDGSPACYSERNVPLKSPNYLKVCTDGIRKGDYAMIMGYPGRTARYSSSAKVRFQSEVELPVENEIRRAQMEIMRKWMDADPQIRMKYADKFFSLSNVAELHEGQSEYCIKYGVARKIAGEEKKNLDAELLSRLEKTYNAVRDIESQKTCFKETMFRGSDINVVAMRLSNNARNTQTPAEVYANLDLRLERELFEYNVKTFLQKIDREYWGPYQTKVYDSLGGDPDAIVDFLWTDEVMTKDSPICRFLTDVKAKTFVDASEKLQAPEDISKLNREYTHALYESRRERGICQAPDANSTMRISYGNVKSFRRGCRKAPLQTWSDEILQKQDTTLYDFTLKKDWVSALESLDKPIPVNFITTNDITGGNSGSPVMNSRGELIGLAFDGNKESLDSDVYYTKAFNRCVCVDIRFVLWMLKAYAGMDAILAEMGL